MEHLTLPSVGASFKKWGSCAPILPNFQKKIQKKNQKFKKGTGPDRPACDQRSPDCRGSTLGMSGFVFFFSNFFSLLPSTFCAFGQLLLVGYTTCPPWPDPT
jgi:hypothetical protein